MAISPTYDYDYGGLKINKQKQRNHYYALPQCSDFVH